MDSVPNKGASPGLYGSTSFPPQPSDVNHPAGCCSDLEPVRGGVYSSPKTNQANPTTGVSSVTSWNSAPSWGPVEDSVTTYTGSKTSQPLPEVDFFPPSFVAGELETYTKKLETGDSELETEELSFGPPPPPPAPYPEPVYRGGEFSSYASIFEDGNEEREVEDQGLLPPYSAPPKAYKLPVASPEDEFAPEESERFVSRGYQPNLYQLFMTGQLPPGTLSHFRSDYETGGDHWGEVHYERYYYPEAEQPAIPSDSQVVPGDELWWQPQYHTKTN